MALSTIALIIIIFLFASTVTSQEQPIPEDKGRVEAWFANNVKPPRERKAGLDPALAAAEAGSPRIIRVRQDGSGEFKTITEAIESVPSGNKKRVIVSIGPGSYQEKVTIDGTKPFITLYGDAKAMPNLTFAGTAAKYGTVNSATLIVLADYFMAVNLCVSNSAPMPDEKTRGAQALAMRISGDKGAFYNCKFYGYQDTVCDDKGNHFFKDCFIQGTFDFIFGSGTSLYLNTELNVIGDGLRVITAQARKSANERSGFSFVHCKVIGTGTGIYLGRAWMSYPKVVYAYTDMTSIVHPAGWSDNFNPQNKKTVFYGEYKCSGAGSSRRGRVDYTQDIDDREALAFLVLGYINGSTWLLPPPRV